MTRWLTLIAIATAFPLGAVAQEPQTPVEEPDIYLSVDVGYNTAYRNGAWAPVDVFVNNELRDVTGWVEVRVMQYSGQRATYRVPADCPANSRKRFRLYVYLDAAERVEAWLMDGERPAHDVPAYVKLPEPIAPNDVLSLILDDSPTDYGFLYRAMQRPDLDRRIHRQHVTTQFLENLPTYPQCYDAFDMIVFGNIDPRAVSEIHRQRIREFVENGGVVVVFAGAQTLRIRGSWLEELAGVSLGETILTNERDLAARVFEPGAFPRASTDRQCEVAELSPAAGDVDRWDGGAGGEDAFTLAAARNVGRGHVVTLAVDSASQVLQSSVPYQSLWNDLVDLRAPITDEYRDQIASQILNTLPYMAGISMSSRRSIITFLGLYFLVGIVLNWAFWSYLKRREMAWLCLIACSIGFTAYAIVSGSVGRAEESSVNLLDIVRLPNDGGTVRNDQFIALISSRSRRYDVALPGSSPLAAEVSAYDAANFRGGRRAFGSGARPFRFVQDDEPRLEEVLVRASELRVIRLESRAPAEGKLEGSLEYARGALRGTLTNNTGYDFPEPLFILANGRFALGNDIPAGATVEVNTPTVDHRQINNMLPSRYPSRYNLLHNIILQAQWLYRDGQHIRPTVASMTRVSAAERLGVEGVEDGPLSVRLIASEFDFVRLREKYWGWDYLPFEVHGQGYQNWVDAPTDSRQPVHTVRVDTPIPFRIDAGQESSHYTIERLEVELEWSRSDLDVVFHHQATGLDWQSSELETLEDGASFRRLYWLDNPSTSALSSAFYPGAVAAPQLKATPTYPYIQAHAAEGSETTEAPQAESDVSGPSAVEREFGGLKLKKRGRPLVFDRTDHAEVYVAVRMLRDPNFELDEEWKPWR